MQDKSQQQHVAQNPKESAQYFLNDLSAFGRDYKSINEQEEQILESLRTFVLDGSAIYKTETKVDEADVEAMIEGFELILNNKKNQLSTGLLGFGTPADTEAAKKLRKVLEKTRRELQKAVLREEFKPQKELEQENKKLKKENQALVSKNKELNSQIEEAKNQHEYLALLFKTGVLKIEGNVSVERLGLDPKLFLPPSTSNENVPSIDNAATQPADKTATWPEKYTYKKLPKFNTKAEMHTWGAENPVDYYKAKLDTALSKDLFALVVDLGQIYCMRTSDEPASEHAPLRPTAADKLLIKAMIYAAFDLALDTKQYRQNSQTERLSQIASYGKGAKSAPLQHLLSSIQSYAQFNDKLPNMKSADRFANIKGMCEEGNNYIPPNPEWAEKKMNELNPEKAPVIPSMNASAN